MSGDLFETFKIINGLVNFGQNMFRKISAYQTSNLLVISRHSLGLAHEFFQSYQLLQPATITSPIFSKYQHLN